jgi:hypothetical protein
MTLSPAAQAVLDAAAYVYWDWSDLSPASSSTIAAAALRAVAEQMCYARGPGMVVDVDDLLSVATELEAQ